MSLSTLFSTNKYAAPITCVYLYYAIATSLTISYYITCRLTPMVTMGN